MELLEQPLPPHVVFFPSPGVGHLAPFFRLAAILESHNFRVSLITTQPAAACSAQLSSFFSTHPNIICLHFPLAHQNNCASSTRDPFIAQVKAINRSVQLLPPLLSSLPHPVSAIFSDFVAAPSLAEITAKLGIPGYIVSNTSALCFSTIAHLPALLSGSPAKFKDGFEELHVPGLPPLPKSIIPPSWLNDSPSNPLLTEYLVPSAQALPKLQGILLNSFDWFEQDAIAALLDGKVSSDLPPVYPIGPLEPHKLEKEEQALEWLDEQAPGSIVYVDFGSWDSFSKDQIREIGRGLERSGFPFLWVLGGKELVLVGDSESNCDSFKEKGMGMVVEGRVKRDAVLAHPAIGVFMSQCEWWSVVAAAREGVAVLAWPPQHGDQKMNTEVVEKAGLGKWVKEWGWGGQRAVKGEEIEEGIRELMNWREKAKRVGEEAKKALEIGGSSENALTRLVTRLKDERLDWGWDSILGT
ncbi:UDP-glycosyltransferase 708G1-like [Diospyros lotus]|uniref:UDP-glycosyltransferase 708G1-like n=1 Tax=Diospyros lotus TaxID=55363 RepID=UPI00225083D4|nr:UDP-glycosyltransferase 708G1-like [Diospyros lotus]